MKLKTLHIVTFPTPNSTLPDICFSVDYLGLQRQFKGGLEAKEIAGIFSTKQEACKCAKRLLKTR